MKELTKGGPAGKGRRKISWKAAACAAAAAVALLFAICAVCMGQYSTEREVKVRYDGQSYTGQASGPGSSYHDGYGYGFNSSRNELSEGINAGMGGVNDVASAPSAPESVPDNSYFDYDATDIYDGDSIADGKKLVYTYDYTVESTQFDAFVRSLDAGLTELGAYTEQMSTDRREYDTLDGMSSNSVRRAMYVLRVPADRMKAFKALLGTDLSDITYENARMSDRTQSYADAELQADSYRAEYARLEELIGQAESVTELIAIQDRLSSLNYSIQWQEKQKDMIDEDVAMSEVRLTVYEALYYTASIEKYRYKIGERMAEAFAEFVSSMPYFLFSMAYVFLGGLVIVLLGRILASVVIGVRNRKAKDTVVRLVQDGSGTDAQGS